MKHLLIASMVVLLAFCVSGCCGKLKEANANLTNEMAKLQQDKAACGDSLTNAKKDIAARDKALMEKAKELQKKSDSFTQMQEAMKAELASKQVAIQELEGKLTLTMVDAILFDSGKADVNKTGLETLAKVANVLKDLKDQEIIVAGYTDNVPISTALAKKFPTNWELSAARAIAVVKMLQSEGVDPSLMSAAGFSEYRPEESNDTPEGRSKNRRMEIILMPKR